MNPKVIDISHHQPDPIDWKKVKAGGTIGVIHKASEGTSYVDQDIHHRRDAAIGAGLCWSTYHFLRPGDMHVQMDHYLATANPVHGGRVCLDHEDPGVSLDDLKAAFRYLMRQRPDLRLTLYSGHVIEEQLNGEYDHFLSGHVDLWTAEYDDRPSEVEWNNATWPKPALWQYSDQESVEGIEGPVDGNKWIGTDAALVTWFGPAVDTPEPALPELPVVTITIAADRDIVLVVNGEQIGEKV